MDYLKNFYVRTMYVTKRNIEEYFKGLLEILNPKIGINTFFEEFWKNRTWISSTKCFNAQQIVENNCVNRFVKYILAIDEL